MKGARDGENGTGYDVKRTRYSGKGTGDDVKGSRYGVEGARGFDVGWR